MPAANRHQPTQDPVELGLRRVAVEPRDAHHDRVTERAEEHDRIVVGVVFEEIPLERAVRYVRLLGRRGAHHAREYRKGEAAWTC